MENESLMYKMFHLMCFIMKTEILYTRVQCKDDRGAVFLFPCCIAAGCSPETKTKIVSLWKIILKIVG